MTRTDPELGTVKRCCACGDEWPLDEEFWYTQPYTAPIYSGTCPECGGEFTTSQRRAIWCGDRCRNRGKERANRLGLPHPPVSLVYQGLGRRSSWYAYCRACTSERRAARWVTQRETANPQRRAAHAAARA